MKKMGADWATPTSCPRWRSSRSAYPCLPPNVATHLHAGWESQHSPDSGSSWSWKSIHDTAAGPWEWSLAWTAWTLAHSSCGATDSWPTARRSLGPAPSWYRSEAWATFPQSAPVAENLQRFKEWHEGLTFVNHGLGRHIHLQLRPEVGDEVFLRIESVHQFRRHSSLRAQLHLPCWLICAHWHTTFPFKI